MYFYSLFHIFKPESMENVSSVAAGPVVWFSPCILVAKK